MSSVMIGSSSIPGTRERSIASRVNNIFTSRRKRKKNTKNKSKNKEEIHRGSSIVPSAIIDTLSTRGASIASKASKLFTLRRKKNRKKKTKSRTKSRRKSGSQGSETNSVTV